MMTDRTLFDLMVNIVSSLPNKPALMIGALPDDKLYRAIAEKSGLRLYFEAFADRLYQDDGSLCPRTQEGAVLAQTDAIVAQAKRIADVSSVVTASGKTLPITAQSLCLHGDNPASIKAIRRIAQVLGQV